MKTINEEYDFTKEIYLKNLNIIRLDTDKSKFQITLRTLERSVNKIDLLLEEIIKTKDNFYVSQILSRVLFEHFLVGYYIYFKTSVNRDDSCGEEYFKAYTVQEFFKREMYDIRIDNLEKGDDTEVTFSHIKHNYPTEFNEMEDKDYHYINKIANQFDIKKIGNFLVNNIHEIDIVNDFHKKMLFFLKRYNYLSSYVHGGPTSEKELFEGKINDKEIICSDNIKWGQIASKQLMLNIIMLLTIESPETYFPLYRKIVEFNL